MDAGAGPGILQCHEFDIIFSQNLVYSYFDYSSIPSTQLFSDIHGFDIDIEESGNILLHLEPPSQEKQPLFCTSDIKTIFNNFMTSARLSMLRDELHPYCCMYFPQAVMDTSLLKTIICTHSLTDKMLTSLLKEQVQGAIQDIQVHSDTGQNNAEVLYTMVESETVYIIRNEIMESLVKHKLSNVGISLSLQTMERQVPYTLSIYDEQSWESQPLREAAGPILPKVIARLQQLTKIIAMFKYLLARRIHFEEWKDTLEIYNNHNCVRHESMIPYFAEQIKCKEENTLITLSDYREGWQPAFPAFSEENVQKEWKAHLKRHGMECREYTFSQQSKDRALWQIRDCLRHIDTNRCDRVARTLANLYHLQEIKIRHMIPAYLDKDPKTLKQLHKLCLTGWAKYEPLIADRHIAVLEKNGITMSGILPHWDLDYSGGGVDLNPRIELMLPNSSEVGIESYGVNLYSLLHANESKSHEETDMRDNMMPYFYAELGQATPDKIKEADPNHGDECQGPKSDDHKINTKLLKLRNNLQRKKSRVNKLLTMLLSWI